MNNNNIPSELIINYLVFKKDLENLKENEIKKVYLIHKKELNKFFEVCKQYENKSIDALKKELSNKTININIKNENIKLISNFTEIEEDNELEFVDMQFLTCLKYNKEDLNNKELILIKVSKNIQKIIFRNNKILTIKNKTMLQFTESPYIFNNNMNDNITKFNNIDNKQKNIDDKKYNNIDKLKSNQIISDSKSSQINILINKKKNSEKDSSNNKVYKFYSQLYRILNNQKEIIKSIKGTLNYKNSTSYLILNKKYFHKLIKIFESDEIYENEERVLQIIEITNPTKDKAKLKEINERYSKRILDLQNEKLFQVEFEEIDEYKYPSNFIFMEDFYLDFLSNDIKNKYKYNMILGNNLLFIKDKEKNKDNNIIVYVFSADENKYSIEAIFTFEDEKNLKKIIESQLKNVENISQYYENQKFFTNINGIQRILDENNNYIGDILIIQKQNNIDVNNVDDKGNNSNDSKLNNNDISDNSNKIAEKNSNKIEDKHTDPQLLFHKYVEALFICIFKIENLRQNFPKNNDMNSLANIIYNFMKNKEINLDDIKKIESKIKELNKDISDLNFENLLNFILDKLHEELNNKKIISKENPKDDNDEKISYDNFKKYYFEQNDSLIQKTFFGVKEANILYNCCQLTKYSFEICKYLSFENANQKNDIQSLVDEWENTFIQGNKYCDMCLIDTDTRIQYKIYGYPEILIIIINNNKNIVKIDIKIKLNKKYEYQLINFISDTKNENNDFNVIYKEENDWRVYQNNNMNKNNIVNDLSKYIPYVIFYGKINKSMTDKISNKSYVTDVFGSSFQSENNNDFLNNFRNNQNNQNNMIPFNNNNFYNFNFNQNYNNLYQN